MAEIAGCRRGGVGCRAFWLTGLVAPPGLAAMLLAGAVAAMPVAGQEANQPPVPSGPMQGVTTPGAPVLLADAGMLANKFAAFGYDLDTVREGERPVPRLFLAALPRDMADVPSIPARKRLFIRSILPWILRVNEGILAERRGLLALLAQRRAGQPWDGNDRAWLDALAADYGVERADDLGALLRRVDVVPVSLAVAQSAEESGWGTSRFARHGHAVFGQRTFVQGNGMVPLRRPADLRFEVRAFTGIGESVRAYMHNLNTHPAYVEFRTRRADLRRRGLAATGEDLVDTLTRYSERGPDYIETIRAIMRGNRLDSLEGVTLDPLPATDRSG